MSDERDLIVIGSGPGGYVAAIRAAQLGLSVAVVEKDPKLGGTCLHRGCIPTKALLHTASLLDQTQKSEDFGVKVGVATLDMVQTQAYKERVVDKSAKGVAYLFKKNKIEPIFGRGRLVGPHEVEVTSYQESQRFKARHILVATGSVPRELGIAPSDGERILNSDPAVLKSTLATMKEKNPAFFADVDDEALNAALLKMLSDPAVTARRQA